MKTTALLLCALAPFVAGSILASEPRGVQTYEFSYTAEGYVSCLGEIVSFDAIVEVRGHVFSTKNGTVHVLDNWTITQFATGLSTGREWLGKGVSPSQSNTKVDGSGVTQWVSRVRFDPVTKGDPALIGVNQFKVTVNANGELIVERMPDPGLEGLRCLPTKN